MPTRTILVVEDDPSDEHLTLRALRLSGVYCSVLVAHSADEAMQFLQRTGPFAARTSPNPVAVFVDNALPGCGGAELVKAIRQMPEARGVPVVVLSGNSDSNLVDRCSKAGANSYLEKPLELADYMDYVGAAAKYWLDLNLAPTAPQGRASAL